MLYITSHTLRDRVGLAVNEAPAAPEPSNNKHWSISNGLAYSPRNPSFDPVQLAPHIPVAAEARGSAYGQQVALAQRTIARLIREVLISQEEREAREESWGSWGGVEQSPNQITQILAQSPAVDVTKRDRSYSVIYSKFCQTQASANQPTWQTELVQYRSSDRAPAAGAAHSQERQLIQQQERQHNLALLGHESNPALKRRLRICPMWFIPAPILHTTPTRGYCSTWKPLRARLLIWVDRDGNSHPVTISSS